MNKQQEIREMLKNGYSYTDIVAKLHVSSFRVITEKKRMILENETKVKEEKNKNMLPDPQENINETMKLKEQPKLNESLIKPLYFETKRELINHFLLSYKKKLSESLQFPKNIKIRVTTKAGYFDIKRISHKEYEVYKSEC